MLATATISPFFQFQESNSRSCQWFPKLRGMCSVNDEHLSNWHFALPKGYKVSYKMYYLQFFDAEKDCARRILVTKINF